MPATRLQSVVCFALLSAMVLAGGCRRPPAESNSALPENVPAPASSLSGTERLPGTQELPLTAAVTKILETAQRTGSIVERCRCGAGARIEESHFVPADVVEQPLQKAMQEIDRRYPQIHWSGEAHERFRVTDGEGTPGLLKVRIREFLVIEDRPPQASLPALWRTAEVESYMRKHGMRVARSARPVVKMTRTSPTVIQTKNATVEQILDRMVEGYRSANGDRLYRAWSYRECRRKSGTLIEIGIF